MIFEFFQCPFETCYNLNFQSNLEWFNSGDSAIPSVRQTHFGGIMGRVGIRVRSESNAVPLSLIDESPYGAPDV